MYGSDERKLQDVEQKVDRIYFRIHELDTLRNRVDSLEQNNQELLSCIAGLRDAIQACLSRIETLEQSDNA